MQHTRAMLLPWLTKGSNLAGNLKYTLTKAVGTISGEKRHSKQLANPFFAGTKHTQNRYVQVCLPHDAESRFLPIHTLCQSDCLHCFSGSSYKLKQVADCKPAQFPIKPCICLEEDRGICCDPEDKHGDISKPVVQWQAFLGSSLCCYTKCPSEVGQSTPQKQTANSAERRQGPVWAQWQNTSCFAWEIQKSCLPAHTLFLMIKNESIFSVSTQRWHAAIPHSRKITFFLLFLCMVKPKKTKDKNNPQTKTKHFKRYISELFHVKQSSTREK